LNAKRSLADFPDLYHRKLEPRTDQPHGQAWHQIKEGYYIVGIDGRELTAEDNLYQFLDGTLNRQTVLHVNEQPSFENAWQEIVKPIASEAALRQRAWVEDNRRLVDSLSNGQLAYVWVPNTSTQGLVSFNRYFLPSRIRREPS
jgi:tricorn protease